MWYLYFLRERYKHLFEIAYVCLQYSHHSAIHYLSGRVVLRRKCYALLYQPVSRCLHLIFQQSQMDVCHKPIRMGVDNLQNPIQMVKRYRPLTVNIKTYATSHKITQA